MRVDSVEANERRVHSKHGAGPDNGSSSPRLDAKKRRLLELLGDLARQGRISPLEIATAVRRSENTELIGLARRVQGRLQDLEYELRFERAVDAFLDGEAEELEVALSRERDASRGFESALSKEHEFTKESLYRIATLERQIQEARESTARLVARSRDSLRTLRKVQTEFDEDPVALDALDPLLRHLYEMGKGVRELHTVALGEDRTPPTRIENR